MGIVREYQVSLVITTMRFSDGNATLFLAIRLISSLAITGISPKITRYR